MLPANADAVTLFFADRMRSERVARPVRWLLLALGFVLASVALQLAFTGAVWGILGSDSRDLPENTLGETALLQLLWAAQLCQVAGMAATAVALSGLVRATAREHGVRWHAIACGGAALLLGAVTAFNVMGILSRFITVPSSLGEAWVAFAKWVNMADPFSVARWLVFAFGPSLAIALGAWVIASFPLRPKARRRIRWLATVPFAAPVLSWWMPTASWLGGCVFAVGIVLLARELHRLGSALSDASAEPSPPARHRWPFLWLPPIVAIACWAVPPDVSVAEYTAPDGSWVEGVYAPTASMLARITVATALLWAWLVPWAFAPATQTWRRWLASAVLATAIAAALITIQSV